MNTKVKAFLVVFAKQAIIGASTTVIAVWQDPSEYGLTTVHGLEHVGVLLLGAIVSREALVWGPKLLAWANS
jgi:hypothetical protein